MFLRRTQAFTLRATSGFTLIELLLVIGIIAILAAIVILAINPTLQLTKAEDAKRTSNAREIKSAINQYIIDNGYPPAGLDSTEQEVCSYGAADTSGCLDLDVLVNEDYLVTLERDVKESSANNLGYTVSQSNNGFLAVEPTYIGQSGGSSGGDTLTASVVGRHVFYNNTSFDGYDSAANSSDDSAIATDKVALLPASTATVNNYVTNQYGLQGIMIDVENLTTTPTVNDFTFKVGNTNSPSTWPNASAPSSVSVRAGSGMGGSDRISILWPADTFNHQWLQVTMLANENTGLSVDDVHYWGSVIGDTNFDSGSPGTIRVNGTDTSGVNANFAGTATIENIYDLNRDTVVDSDDYDVVTSHYSGFTIINVITVP